MTLKRITSIVVCLLLFVAVNLKAQDIDFNSIDVDKLSDAQIERLITELDSRGIDEAQFTTLAKAKGASDYQITTVLSRMSEVKSGMQGQESGDPIDTKVKVVDYSSISKKALLNDSIVSSNQGVFGFKFFNTEGLSFTPSENAQVPSNYLIGAGDAFNISVYGASEKTYQAEVGNDGCITLSGLGKIRLSGMNYDEAQKLIKAQLTQIHADIAGENPTSFVSINLSQIRTINVNVIGEANVPGTYQLPGTSSIFGALYLAGGPNINGSFREVKLVRDGKTISTIDIYDFILNGEVDNNVLLKDNDIILISPYDKRITVEGQFKRVGTFEAKEGETVDDIIRFAGGFNENAYTKRLELYRKNGTEREFLDVLNKDFSATDVENGDKIVAGVILPRYKNMVSINGAVFRPGNYQYKDGMTLKNLIDNAEGLREDVFLERGVITRQADDLSLQNIAFNVRDIVNGANSISLKKNDEVLIQSIDSLREFRTIEILGEVAKPGVYDYKQDMTLADIVYLAGGFKESASDAYIEVARRLQKDEYKEYSSTMSQVYQEKVPSNLELKENDSSFELQAFDKVFIRKLPGYNTQAVVKVSGEIMYEGQYALQSKTDRVSDIIARSGGFTEDAYPKGAILTRRSTQSLKQDEIKNGIIKRNDNVNNLDLDYEIVGIELDKIMKKPGSPDDIYLLDGDELYIPQESTTIKVSGEVLNPLSLTFNKGMKLRKYVSHGGGFTVDAKRNKVYVVYSNGTAKDTKSFLFFRRYPKVEAGAEVIVPTRPAKLQLGISGWIGVASSISTMAIAIVAAVK